MNGLDCYVGGVKGRDFTTLALDLTSEWLQEKCHEKERSIRKTNGTITGIRNPERESLIILPPEQKCDK